MELRIVTQMEAGVLPEIQWNNDELKQEVAAKAAEYKVIAYTDAQEKEMRNDRATLNKLVTAFEDQRKQVKKFYQAPYDKFEAQVKEVLNPVREAIRSIDDGLAEIERNYRSEKTNKMRNFYEEHVGDLRPIIPFEKTINEYWYRKSVTDKKLEQGYIDLFNRIRCDLSGLDELPERFRDKATVEYMKNFSLGEALQEGKRLEELEKSMEERRNKLESERPATQEVTIKEPAQEASSNPPVMCLNFRVWGTSEQLMALRQYMIDNHLKFGKAE